MHTQKLPVNPILSMVWFWYMKHKFTYMAKHYVLSIFFLSLYSPQFYNVFQVCGFASAPSEVVFSMASRWQCLLIQTEALSWS